MVVLLLLIAACTPSGTTRPAEPEVPEDAAAQAALERGDNQAAAQAYLQLAGAATDGQTTRWRLAAADAMLRDARAADARAVLDGTGTGQADAGLRRWREILEADLDALAGAWDAALRRLSQYQEVPLPPAQLHGFYRARARSLEGNGNWLEAARTRVALAPLVRGGSAVAASNDAIWNALENVPQERLRQAKGAAGDTFTGWLELAFLARTSLHRAEEFRQASQAWAARYPNHPALTSRVPALLASSQTLALRPRRVAVLVPLSGRFGDAGRAVQDGIITAWFADPERTDKPLIRVYDTDATNISARYDQAVKDGAELVIGPLEKAAVEVLARRAELPRTVLALNSLDQPPDQVSGAPLYQFGLSPEQEASQVAERAWFDGHRRALAVSPSTRWGERVFAAFRERWLELGGLVLEHVEYNMGAQDFAAPTKALLNVDGSEQRYSALRNLLQRDIGFEVRRRQDADFVFLAAFPVQGRQIRPQLEFFRASTLPVYATSHVYTGTIDREADRDMNGVRFADMPWLIAPGRRSTELFNAVVRNWSANARTYPRLYALGIDAYNVLGELGRMKVERQARVRGQTGILRIDGNGRLVRQLLWAEFVDGEPRALDEQQALAGP